MPGLDHGAQIGQQKEFAVRQDQDKILFQGGVNIKIFLGTLLILIDTIQPLNCPLVGHFISCSIHRCSYECDKNDQSR